MSKKETEIESSFDVLTLLFFLFTVIVLFSGYLDILNYLNSQLYKISLPTINIFNVSGNMGVENALTLLNPFVDLLIICIVALFAIICYWIYRNYPIRVKKVNVGK